MGEHEVRIRLETAPRTRTWPQVLRLLRPDEEVAVVLSRRGDDLWIGSDMSPEETLQVLRAAIKAVKAGRQ